MILLDSCALLDILFGEPDGESLSEFLDAEQSSGNAVVVLNLILLESSTVTAVRFKEGRIQRDLDSYLNRLAAFQAHAIADDLTGDLIAEASRIKAEHAASMVDCYLIANALHRKAEIVTADAEILRYDTKRAKARKITRRYAALEWRS